MELPAPEKEHHWLQRLVGEWTYESEAVMGAGEPPIKSSGSETVRSLGGFWTIGEGTGQTPGGGLSYTVMTLGYDPPTKRFVGTFIVSMMAHLWPYRGTLDAAEKVLTLDSEGPSFAGDGTMAKYQDIIEFVSDDHRTLKAVVLGPDGKWTQFMTAHYHRKR